MKQKKLSYSSVAKKIMLPLIAIMTIVLVVLWNGKMADAANSTDVPLNVYASGKTFTYSIDAPCSVSSSVSWISISRPSANKFMFTVAENRSDNIRTGTVTVKRGNTVVKRYKVTQEGYGLQVHVHPSSCLASGGVFDGYVDIGVNESLYAFTSNSNWCHIRVDNNRYALTDAKGDIVGYRVFYTLTIDRNTTRRYRHAKITICHSNGYLLDEFTYYQSSNNYYLP